MKLHLPKALFTAVMALFAVSQTTWGVWDPADTWVLQSTDKNISTEEATPNSHKYIFLRAGDGATDITLDSLTLADKDAADGKDPHYLVSVQNSEDGQYTFDKLTINSLIVNEASATLEVAGSSKVQINGITNTLRGIKVAAGTSLTLGDGKTATTFNVGGNNSQSIEAVGTFTVAAKSTLKFVRGSDSIAHSTSNCGIIMDGSIWESNASRQSLGKDFTLTLRSGTVQDTTSTHGFGDGYGVLDAASSGVSIVSSGTSSISGGLRVRGNAVTINVTDNTLSLDTIVNQSGQTGGIVKQGEGTLKITKMTGNNQSESFYGGDTELQAGTIEYAIDKKSESSTSDGTYKGTISGTGNIAKSGTGTVTLANINGLNGDISVSGGTLNIENATALSGAISVTGGTLNAHGLDLSGVTSLSLAEGATLGISKKIDGSNGTFNLNGKIAIIEGTDLTNAFAVDTTRTSYASAADGSGSGAVSGYATGNIHYIIADHVTAGSTLSIEGYDASSVLTENNQILLSVGTGNIDTSTFYINEDAAWGTAGYTDNTAKTYSVAAGKTFDAKWIQPTDNNPFALQGKDLTLNTGATLKNTGASTGTSWAQFKNMTLQGDAYVDGEKNIGLLGPGYESTKLTLNGNTLIKKGDSTFYMIRTTTDAGVIDIQGGAVHSGHSGYTTDASAATFKLSGGNLHISDVGDASVLKVAGLTGASTTSLVKGGGILELTGAGDFTSEASLTETVAVTVNKASGTQTLSAGADWTGNLTLTSGTLKLNMADASTLDYSRITRTNGSLVLSGGGTYTIADNDLAMNNMGVTVDSSWRGNVIITNTNIGGCKFEQLGTSNSTLKLVGYSGWMNSNGKDIQSNIELENYSGVDGSGNAVEKSAFIFNDSSENWNYRFAGAVSGSGDFQIATQADAPCNIHFNGSTENWKGGIIVTNAYENAGQSDDQKNNTPTVHVNLAGGGNIFSAEENNGFVMDRASKNTGTNIINLNIGNAAKDSTMNGAISMGENADENSKLNLAVKGNTTFKKNVEVSTLTVDANKTATLEGTTTTGTLITNGKVKVTGSGSLTYGGNTTVEALPTLTRAVETSGAEITSTAITGGKVTFTGDAVVTESRTISDSAIVNNATGTANITVGVQNASVNAAAGNIAMTADSTSVGELTVGAGKSVSTTGALTVTQSLTLSSTDALLITGALTLDGASINLTGLDLQQDVTSYTLGTAASISAVDVTVLLSDDKLAAAGFTGYKATVGASDTNAGALVLTLSQEVLDATLTATGVSYDGENNILTLGTNLAAGTTYTWETTEDAVIGAELWQKAIDEIVGAEGGAAEVTVQFTYDGDGGVINLEALGVQNLTLNGMAAVGGTATIEGGKASSYLIPEPTTGTLSILALAALAVRRRRR